MHALILVFPLGTPSTSPSTRQKNPTLVRCALVAGAARAQRPAQETPIGALDDYSKAKPYPLPIAFPSVTAWIARATVATLPALRPAMEMRPSFVR